MKPHNRGATWMRPGGLALVAVLVCLPAFGANMVTGVSAGVGTAVDTATNTIYYVEFNGGTLKRVAAARTCTTATSPPCTPETVASNLHHPEDVALDPVHHVAYVTTRDDPGMGGALWRLDLNATLPATPTLVTFNLGAPHQIVLDVATDTAYVVGFDSGRLWKIDLTTGSKVTMMSGLGHPIGLAVTSDRAYAFVTEQDTVSLSKIDLALHARVVPAVLTGLTAPFFLSWMDPGESSLFLVERSPHNDVVRVDLPTSTGTAAITGLAAGASGIAVDWLGGVVYITTDSSVVRIDLLNLPLMSEPVFLGVGFLTKDEIDSDGYATTSSNPRIHVKDAPFGGTLDILGNFNKFKTSYSAATHYRLLVSYNGAAAVPVTATWTSLRLNPSNFKYEPVSIAPVAAISGSTDNTLYKIPDEYPAVPERWSPPFLMLRWLSGLNGLYRFSVELYNVPTTGAPTQVAFAATDQAHNELMIRVDNDPPQVDLLQVYQFNAATNQLTAVKTCAIVSTAPQQFKVGIEAYDPNGHMLSYSVWANWGHNRSGTVIPTEQYEPGHVVPSRMWYGQTNLIGPAAGWTPNCNCAHTFYVGAWKRTINGYWHTSYRQAHQSVTINNVASPTNCP